jgi:hypothetical protein
MNQNHLFEKFKKIQNLIYFHLNLNIKFNKYKKQKN